MLTKILYTALILILLFCNGCEKDNVIPPVNINIEKGAELLQYLEGKGDYVNTNLIPLISADDLFLQRNEIVIADVRSSSDYLSGHIEGSFNIKPELLYDSLINFKEKKIVLVSRTGEASAYYALLLRIAGFNNVFTLNFGLAAWNNYFSGYWTNRLKDNTEWEHFSTDIKSKNIFYQLPDPGLKGVSNSIEEKVIARIKELLSEGFTEETGSAAPKNSVEYDKVSFDLTKYYVVCAGPAALYYSKLYGTYHLIGASNYRMFPDLSDFRSISYLQTLPDNKNILIYSGSGQESAFITAYLKLLGYNAASILLGCNNFSYTMLAAADQIRIYQFNNSVVKNYPYVK